MRSLFCACLVLAAFVLSPITRAQTAAGTEWGIQPNAYYDGGDIDHISILTGNLYVHIPLISYPQRGSLQLSFALQSNNKGWIVADMNAPPLTPHWVVATGSFLASVQPVYDQAWFGSMTGNCGPPHNPQSTFTYTLRGPDGLLHGLGLVSGTKPTSCKSFGPLTMESYDGTGIRVSGSYPGVSTVIGPNGDLYQGLTGRADANGNEISIAIVNNTNVLTDTNGRSIPEPPLIPGSGTLTTDYSGCSGPLPIASAALWSPPGPNGGTTTYKFCYVTVSLQTAFDQQGVTEGSGTQTFVQSVVLPNNTTWTFEYNAYGDLTEIVLPTGGSISYGYINYAGASQGNSPRAVASRTVNANDGTGSHTWNYQWGTLNTSNHTYTVTSTDPLGNATVYTNSLVASPVEGGPYETTLKQIYQGPATGTPLETITTSWQLTTAQVIDSVPTFQSAFPTQQTTTWANGKTKETTTTYDSGLTWANGVAGSYGKVTRETDSDYGNGSPGLLLRTISTNYQWQGNSTYLNDNFLDLVSSVQITNSSGTQLAYATLGYDETTPTASNITTQHVSAPNGNIRGNLTSVHKWLNTTGGYLINTVAYFDTGEVQTASDPKGNVTTYGYSSTYAGAYPTTVTNALHQSMNYAYDFNTGLLTSATDPNSQTISFSYDPQTWRKIQTKYPPSGQISYCYSDTPIEGCASGPPYQIVRTTKITSSQNLIETDVMDGIGRPSQTRIADPQGTIYADTTYDADGHVFTVSNPYRTKSEATYGVTTYQYDALDRTTLVMPPDGTSTNNNVSIQYCGGSSTLETDQVGHWRRGSTDGLGRLIEMDEPNSPTATVNVCPSPGEPIWVTSYSYDAIGNLTNVVQGGSRTRKFFYDSLNRLTSSQNPETGSVPVTYAYDANGNLTMRTDARGIVTNYSPSTSPIDPLNRVTSKTYSDGTPTVTYAYDGNAPSGCSAGTFASANPIGRRTGMCDAGGSEFWSYDPMGRVSADQRTTNSIAKTTSYTYDFNGDLATLTYPSGRTITYATDSAARPSTAQDLADNISYMQGTCSNGSSSLGVCYAPQGAISSSNIGPTGGATWLDLTVSYTKRLQPNQIHYSNQAGALMSLQYSFVDANSHNNGNVMEITNLLNGTRTQQFTYDQLNRIASAQTPSPCGANCWSQTFNHDQWTNLLSATDTGIAPPSLSPLTINANNQITNAGFKYDAAGDETADLTSNYAYNAESEIKTAGGVNYTYDGDGNRIQKSNGKIYWYGAGREVLYESDSSGNITDEYVFFGGQRIAHRVVSANNIYYYGQDFLGSSRQIYTTASAICYDADLFPYGGEHDYTTSCSQNYKFEGKERDTETYNDDFGARYYSSTYGRFLTADWSPTPTPIPYADISNPQTLNLYALAADNPESFADLDGHVQTGDEWKELDMGTFGQVAGPQGGIKPPLWRRILDELFGDKGTTTPGKVGPDPTFYDVWMLIPRGAVTVLSGAKDLARTLPKPPEVPEQFIQAAGYAAGLPPEDELGELLAPSGQKMAQIIARLGIGHGNPAAAMEALTAMRNAAVAAGQTATGAYIEADTTIYRIGNDFLTVSKSGKVLSYVKNAEPGWGVAKVYLDLGGK